MPTSTKELLMLLLFTTTASSAAAAVIYDNPQYQDQPLHRKETIT